MRRSPLFPICLGLALALHILPFLALSSSGSRAAGAGSGGRGQVTLAAASQELVQLAAHWKRPPTVPSAHPAIAAPEVQSQPQPAALPTRPEVSFPVSHLANHSPQLQAAPFADASPELAVSPSPPPKPVAPEKPAQPPVSRSKPQASSSNRSGEMRERRPPQPVTQAERPPI
jgi:hypothetical protein